MEAVQTRGRQPRRLLLATDRSAASRAAGVVVAGLAMGGHTEVVVLHVDDRGHPEDAQRLADEVACGLLAIAVNARAGAKMSTGRSLRCATRPGPAGDLTTA